MFQDAPHANKELLEPRLHLLLTSSTCKKDFLELSQIKLRNNLTELICLRNWIDEEADYARKI
jgi:hypothetical protein